MMNEQTYLNGLSFVSQMAGNAEGVTWNRLFRAGLSLKGLCFYPAYWRDPRGMNRDITAPVPFTKQEAWPTNSIIGPIDP
jgi:hypothetical protein